MQPVNLYVVYFIEADTLELNFDHVLATNQTEAREIFLKDNEEEELYNIDHIEGVYQITGTYKYQDKEYTVSAHSLS